VARDGAIAQLGCGRGGLRRLALVPLSQVGRDRPPDAARQLTGRTRSPSSGQTQDPTVEPAPRPPAQGIDKRTLSERRGPHRRGRGRSSHGAVARGSRCRASGSACKTARGPRYRGQKGSRARNRSADLASMLDACSRARKSSAATGSAASAGEGSTNIARSGRWPWFWRTAGGRDGFVLRPAPESRCAPRPLSCDGRHGAASGLRRWRGLMWLATRTSNLPSTARRAGGLARVRPLAEMAIV
jgi:hypothetical protein